MKKLLLVVFALMLAASCGDDSSMPMDGGSDTGTSSLCPVPGEQMGACCYRESNAANPDTPMMRVAGVEIATPPSLATIVVTSLLVAALDDELFNWLISTEISGTDATITTGYGVKNADGTFSFTMGTAPGPGDPNRWDPVTITGSIAGETVSAPELNQTLTVPVLDEDGTTVTLELPLRNMSITMATLSEDRSTIGSRLPGGRWTSDQGQLQAYITVEDADAGILDVPDAMIYQSLCTFIANMPAEGGDCAAPTDCTTGYDCVEGTCTRPANCVDVAQSEDEWASKPDSLCDTSGCTQDPGDGSVCDPGTTCNAWFISAGFAAQGVTIN
jgi:hypothetical protein